MKTGGIILLPSFGFLLRKNRGRSINYSVCFRRLFSLASSSQASYLSHPRLKKACAGSQSFRCSSSPQKVCRTFRGPRDILSSLENPPFSSRPLAPASPKIHRFHPDRLHRASLSGEKQTDRLIRKPAKNKLTDYLNYQMRLL